MIKRLYTAIFLLGVVFALSACGGGSGNPASPPAANCLAADIHAASSEIPPGAFVTDLIAAETVDVGSVIVWYDGSYLYVKYETDEPWTMTATHLYAALVPPATGEPEGFPYAHPELDEVTEDLYEIPMSKLLGSEPGFIFDVYIAAHADVSGGGGVLATRTLWAGQHFDSGIVTVAIEGEELVVAYETKDGWELLATHLYVGTEPPGKSAPGRFPYKHEDLGGATSDTYRIPLSELGVEYGDTLYFAAQAELRKPKGYDSNGEPVYQEETGWAFDDTDPRIPPGKNWARYFSAVISGGAPQAETAWAFGPYVLPGVDWGWYFEYWLEFFPS